MKIFTEMPERQRDLWKTTIITIIFVDIFGIYWYLDQRKIGIAILLVCAIFFAILLITERREEKEPKKMDEDNREQPRKEDKDEWGFDLGLPSPEEYEKRVSNAIGSPI